MRPFTEALPQKKCAKKGILGVALGPKYEPLTSLKFVKSSLKSYDI
jgi:hypothetical protein